MQLKQILTVLVFMVPAVMSTQCKNNEFWWKSKGCCLKNGGPPNPPPPPHGTRCPKDSHYWHTGNGCCAPRNPPEHKKPPKCDKDWEWKPSEHKCKPCTTPPPPQTSPKPDETKNKDKDKDCKDKGKDCKDKDKDDKDKDKDKDCKDKGKDCKKDKDDKDKEKDPKKRRATRPVHCPVGLWACPTAGLTGDYECLDIATELESCGGCSTLGQGQDCTKIEGAWNVGCERGTCKIYSCDAGYTLAKDSTSCEAL